MKKLLFTFLLLTSPVSFAQEAKGVIEEIQICSPGTSGVDWARLLQFKVDGMWFATWSDHISSAVDEDNNITTSLVLMAYSQNIPVYIKATAPWHPYMTKCGISDGKVLHRNAGDFIRISR